MSMGDAGTVETKAITPEGVIALKQKNIPAVVFEAFNDLIAANFTSGEASFTQNEVVDAILVKFPLSPPTRQYIFDAGWLNVEEVYDFAGWDVDYDKPGYNETYEANFTFTPKQRR